MFYKTKLIVKRDRYFARNMIGRGGSRVKVTLECGHERFYKGSAAPLQRARCPECELSAARKQ